MLRRFSFALVPSALLALAACDSTGTGGSGGTGNQGGNGGSGNQGNDGGSGGILFGGQGGFGGQQQAALNIAPVNPTLNVLYGLAGPTVQFTATDINGQAVNPVWSLDTPEAGTISANGLFTANGVGAGEVQVYAKLGDQQAQTTLTIIMTATENPANLGAGEVAVLQGGGGGSDPNFVLWYPYDNTIFPRGILSPQWQLSTNEIQPTAYYVHMSSPTFTYDGFLPPLAGQKRFQIGQGIWDAAGSALGGAPVTVEISKLVNGQKYGPITRTVRIAKGKLKGTVYYNTYDNVGAGSGAIMRIKGTDVAPTIHIGNCTVCHSVASDGSTGAAANHSGPGGVFDFLNGNALTWQTPELTAFGALYPKNGEVILIQGAPGGSWPPNTPGTSGNWTSSLYTKNGAQIPSSGIEGYYAQTPVFSHDGKHVAFYDRPAGGGTGNLVMMDYDELTQKFTNYQVLVAGIGGEHLSWPAFTPDGKWVVYQRGVGDDLATWSANTGKLWAVNVVTKVATELANVNGDAYVPQGARDINLNYEPTILPIASGGYFWLMFTSRRTYGNTLLADRYSTKRLWVAALDLNGQDGVDFSHPGFYVQGQDLNSGNSRGFWALDPCKSDGQGCESGDECCNGFCNPSDADPNVFVCGQPTGSCSHEFESCVTAADCCDASSLCINGKCSQPPPN